MYKILYFITKSNWGGTQRYVYDLATNLNKHTDNNFSNGETVPKFDIKIYAGLSGNSNILFEKIEEFNKNNLNKIETKKLNLHNDFNIWKSFLNLFEFYNILKEEKPDVIHVNSSKISIMMALAARVYNIRARFARPYEKNKRHFIKIIFTAHGWPHSETHRSLIFRIFTQMMMIITVILSDKTICVSENTKKSLLNNDFLNNLFKKYLDKKIKIIYNGIDQNEKIRLPKLREQIDSEHYGKINLVSIGEYHPNKGHDTVIKYINELDNVHYHIIGSGVWQSHLENLIQNTNYDKKEKQEKINVSDKVSLLHIPHNAAHVLSRYDIFLMPSRKEGFSYVIPEALNAGLPVIARDVGGAGELLTTPTPALPQGEEATQAALTLYNDDYELIEILKSFKRESLINYHEWIDDNFSIENMIRETVKIYE